MNGDAQRVHGCNNGGGRSEVAARGAARLIAAVAEAEAVTVAAAAADGFIDWHCRHRPEESVSGVRELC